MVPIGWNSCTLQFSGTPMKYSSIEEKESFDKWIDQIFSVSS